MMIKSKRQMFTVISVFTLVMLLGTISYAFFNYTRTGAANRISVGDIYFTSSYDEVALDGVFPIAKSTINSDTDNVMSVDVDIEGHTSYVNGLYYEVKAEDVNLTVNGKNIPIGISVSSNNLDNVTLTNYEDGKVLTNDSLFANGRILASTGTTDNSVDGTITIKAYLDKDRIAISDTYNGLETDLMGTTTGWVGGRVVLTTSEWNSLASTPISFKIKVEAYENDVSTLVVGSLFNKKIKKLSGSITAEKETEIEQQLVQLQMMIDSLSPEQLAEAYAMYGISTPEELYSIVITSVYIEMEDTNITTFERVAIAPNIDSFTEDNIISTYNSIYPIYAWYENGVIKYYSESDNIKANDNMSYMFLLLESLTSIGSLSGLDTTNVTNMSYMFYNCTSLTNLSGLANWNVSNVTLMNDMFYNANSLTTLDVSNWNTLNITNMSSMFRGCTSLTNLSGLASWNVSNVTNMSNMFRDCTGLTNLNGLANLNTSNVINMGNMFFGCTGLTNINELTNWNTSNVIDMSGMFCQCDGLTNTSGLANWNTSNVTTMSGMFQGCIGLTNLDLSGFDTSKVTSFYLMFYQCGNLVSIDLSSFNSINVEDLSYMFSECPELVTVYVSELWNTDKVTNDSNIFGASVASTQTKKIVGGSGTTFNSSKRNKEYARIDDPANGKPGYFTYKAYSGA